MCCTKYFLLRQICFIKQLCGLDQSTNKATTFSFWNWCWIRRKEMRKKNVWAIGQQVDHLLLFETAVQSDKRKREKQLLVKSTNKATPFSFWNCCWIRRNEIRKSYWSSRQTRRHLFLPDISWCCYLWLALGDCPTQLISIFVTIEIVLWTRKYSFQSIQLEINISRI